MTRLCADDMIQIARDLDLYDRGLRAKTGVSLKELACCAAGIDEREFTRRAAADGAAVVPITGGRGIITGFTEAVQRILAHIGLDAEKTVEADAAGLAQAYAQGRSLIFLADDKRFLAINTRDRTVADNAEATGAAFAWGLNLMAGRLEGKSVLVLGCGRVGLSAAKTVLGMGAKVFLYDHDAAVLEQGARQLEPSGAATLEYHLEPALGRHRLLIDATPAASLIDEESVRSDTYISAPGVPLGVTALAAEKLSNRLLHDQLEIGVASMAAFAIRGNPQGGI
jgi:pyrrolysine biosynthesis protein PylD